MREIEGTTQIVGVFGWPVEHSLSPPMHNAAYAALGLDYVYVPFPVRPARLAEALAGVKALGVRGVNLTIPHKLDVLPLLDEASAEVRQIGAANTVRVDDGRLLGYNTDMEGYVRAVEETGADFRGRRVVQLGAGGVGRAMAFGAAHAGARALTIVNRTVAKAEGLADEIRQACPAVEVAAVSPQDAAAREAVATADVLANATSVGMHDGDGSPAPLEWIRPETFVYDTIYNRPSPLIVGARERGCRTLDGATMLVHQGAIAIEIWTGRTPDAELMLKVLRAELARRKGG